ncbi:lysozyme-like domain-containing protein [Chytriomyces sp. MP71]|nr:lysozyme-like domain-containing protein [Chytriomyces sp. MP71]
MAAIHFGLSAVLAGYALAFPAPQGSCQFGAYQCSGQNYQICNYGAGNVLSFVTLQTCGSGTVCSVARNGCVAGVPSSAPPVSSSVAPSSAKSSTVLSAKSTTKPPTTTSTVSAVKITTTVTVVPTTTANSISAGAVGCYIPWSSGQAYNGGAVVSQNNMNYHNKWYEGVGASPSANTDSGWISEGPCNPSLPVPTGSGGGGGGTQTPPIPTTLAGARAYAASLSQDPNLVLLKKQTRTNTVVSGIIPGSPTNPDNVKRVERILAPTKWQFYFSLADPAYTYENFLKSVGFFAGFCDEYPGQDSDAICKKLLSTMFAHFAQETGAHDGLIQTPQWRQALKYVREISCTETNTISGCYYNNDCTNPAFNQVFPCGTGPDNGYLAYFGRGAHQLSYSFNYGPFSEIVFNGDPTVLLNNPSQVADTWLNLASAIFFFIYPQPPKASMLGVMDGTYVPNAADLAAGRVNGFATTIQIINGECAGGSLSNAAANRISYYKSFAADMGLDVSGDAFNCSGMGRFDASSAGSYAMYWTGSYLNKNACQLVSYQTNFNALMDGPSYDQYVKCVETTYGIKLT